MYAGSLLNSEFADIKITETGNKTKIGKFLQKVEDFHNEKSLFTKFGEKYSTVFSILVITISILSLIVFLQIFTPQEGFERVMAFILISCPCAFIFALPLAYRKSLMEGINKGFVIKNFDIYDKFSKIKHIFFDKTGTLTKAIYKVIEWQPEKLSKNDLDAIFSLENKSNHPISAAIINSLTNFDVKIKPVLNFKKIDTKGISGIVDNAEYKIISKQNDKYDDNEKLIVSKIEVFKESNKISTIYLGDELVDDATELIGYLKNCGYKQHIISGDNQKNVVQVADKLSLPSENIYWNLNPQDKIEILNKNGNSIMIGDGLNDAGAFTSADISIAVKGSVEKNFELSDVFLIKDNIANIKELFNNIRFTTNSVKRNTFISIGYNIIAGYFALSGHISPLIAAVLMPLSSLILLTSTYYGNYFSRNDIS